MLTKGYPAIMAVVQAESTPVIPNGGDYVRHDSLLSHLVNIPVYTGTNFSSRKKLPNSSIGLQTRDILPYNRLADQAQMVLLNFRDEIKNEKNIFRILGSHFETKKDNATLL